MFTIELEDGTLVHVPQSQIKEGANNFILKVAADGLLLVFLDRSIESPTRSIAAIPLSGRVARLFVEKVEDLRKQSPQPPWLAQDEPVH